jgi:hypothetical protein
VVVFYAGSSSGPEFSRLNGYYWKILLNSIAADAQSQVTIADAVAAIYSALDGNDISYCYQSGSNGLDCAILSMLPNGTSYMMESW